MSSVLRKLVLKATNMKRNVINIMGATLQYMIRKCILVQEGQLIGNVELCMLTPAKNVHVCACICMYSRLT